MAKPPPFPLRPVHTVEANTLEEASETLEKLQISGWKVQCIENRMRNIAYLCAALLPLIARGQELSIGFTGGAPAEAPVGRSASKLPFVIGPTLSVGVLGGLSLETGVLFHRLGATEERYALLPSLDAGLVLGTDRWKARAIEVPLLLKYRFLSRSHTWRPFLSAGPAFRRTTIEYTGVRSIFSEQPLDRSTIEPVRATETVKWNADPAAGAGASFRSGRVQIEPEVRYSHWGAGKHEVVRQNQVHFLFGLRF